MEKKERLPQSEELIAKKRQAFELMRKCFQDIHDLGLNVVSFDATYNQIMDPSSVEFITSQEWKHGVW